MASLGSLVIELAANTARLQGDLGKAVGMAERTASKFTSIFRGLAVGAGGLGLASLAGQAISLGDELQKGAARAGVSAGEFSKLAAAAKQADVDIGTLSRGLKEMQKTISEAGTGSKTAIDSLDAIGLSVDRLRQLSPTKQLEAIADGLNSIADPADRSRRGAEILGKAYLDLVPALQGGAAGLRALVAEQVRLGNTFSDEQIARLADADDAIKRLKASWSGFATTLTALVAPALTSVLNQLAEMSASKSLDDIEDRLRILRGARDSIPVFFNFGYIDGAGRVLGPEALDKEIARLERVAALQSGRRSRGRGSAPATLASRVQADAEAATAATEALVSKTQQLGDLNISLNARAAELVNGRGLLDFTDLEGSILESTEGIADRMGEALKEPFTELTPYAADVARGLDGAFADFFRNADGGFKGLARSVAQTFGDILAQIAAVKLRMAIFGNVDDKGNLSGGLLSAGINALFGGFGGGKAAGGPVSAGTSYLVGERGPELFTPRVSGAITPNKAGRSMVVNYSPTINAAQLTQQQAAAMMAEERRKMWDELDRRWGLA